MDIFDYAECGVFAQPLRDACVTYQQRGLTDGDFPYMLAQLDVESMHFSKTVESLIYHAQGLLNVCDGRNGVSSLAAAQAVVNQGPQAIAEALYGGSWGAQHLGNTQPGDAYKFIGHGLIQLTGRWNYQAASNQIYGDDRLLQTPELLTIAKNAALAAVWFYCTRSPSIVGCRDVSIVTKGINGGYAALQRREAITARLLSFVP